MRVVEIYVERLKSYGDYSNRKVGLRAVLEEGEDLKEAYLSLARACETLLEIQGIEANIAEVELYTKVYEERKRELERLREEYRKIREELSEELSGLRQELEKVERLIEEKRVRLKDEVIERLRRIRSALTGFDP